MGFSSAITILKVFAICRQESNQSVQDYTNENNLFVIEAVVKTIHKFRLQTTCLKYYYSGDSAR
jgi:hypothetical protein